jgi:hypothetical protein
MDRTRDIDAVQEDREHGNLVRLRAHFHLTQDRAVRMVESGQQVIAGFTAAR